MRSKTIFGALLVSVALCSQGFGFELLDRMLGLSGGGCGECNACAKVAPCEKVGPQACDPACAKACDPACAKACDPACAKACEPLCVIPEKAKCKKARCTPVRDLFDGMCDLFEAKGKVCDTGACDPAKGCAPDPACEKACPKACEPACNQGCEKSCKTKKVRKPKCDKGCGPAACESVAACEPACEKACEPKCHKLYRRPVVELLESMFGCDKGCKAGCETGCEVGCAAGCNGAAPAAAPGKAPSKAPEAAPLPAAPKADPSASIQSRGIYQASRSLVRN